MPSWQSALLPDMIMTHSTTTSFLPMETRISLPLSGATQDFSTTNRNGTKKASISWRFTVKRTGKKICKHCSHSYVLCKQCYCVCFRWKYHDMNFYDTPFLEYDMNATCFCLWNNIINAAILVQKKNNC